MFIVDDLPQMLIQGIAQSFPTVLRDQPYNRWWYPQDVVYGMEDIRKIFDRELELQS
jgi:hypothetical protein